MGRGVVNRGGPHDGVRGLHHRLTLVGEGGGMSTYRRPPVTGAMIFFTVALASRGGDVLVREIGLLREAVRVTKAERPFGIEAWVVLPDHMHAVWRMPAGDRAYGVRWGAIKARFTRAVREKYATDEVGCRPGFSPAMPAQPAYDTPRTPGFDRCRY